MKTPSAEKRLILSVASKLPELCGKLSCSILHEEPEGSLKKGKLLTATHQLVGIQSSWLRYARHKDTAMGWGSMSCPGDKPFRRKPPKSFIAKTRLLPAQPAQTVHELQSDTQL